ncbi:outer membrane lipoprotein LolB [Duganella callida]|uniref:Outer-membrane lipoprotein LolB n=1 Tax=Duganella callida TaxID=2561932 RepID=A0A4Y9STQ4_9BURK|nr:outer membrane lipoprotein LolB [Duganella callida]TFW29855.1 outer membrane lipoprotein LolB [Duganella callida]
MIRPLLTALAIAAAAVLAGCATTPSAPRSSAAVAPYHDSIELAGRIAINYSRDGKKESLNGKFTWQQTRANTDVSLISPTGQTVAVIKLTPTSATLQESGKAPRSAPDLDSLSAQTLGWSLPVSGLRNWLQGHAVGSDGQPFVASPANDTVITRDGWKLEYMSWQDETAAVPQPKRIDVTRIALGQAVDDMAIRIVIDPPAQ